MFYYRKVGLLLVMFLFALAPISAISYNAEIVPITDKITVDDVAEFLIIIENFEITDETFRIRTTDFPRWDVRTKPILNPILIDVPAKSSANVSLFVDPNQNYLGETGSHLVGIVVSSESSDDKTDLEAKVGFIPRTEPVRDYVPTVTIETTIDPINPSRNAEFSVILQNQNSLDMKEATLRIESDLVNKEFLLDISPKERKTIDITQTLDPKTQPQQDTLKISLHYKGEEVDSAFEPITIIQYSEVTDQATVKKSFLRTDKTIVYTNEGNVPFTGDLTTDTTGVKKLFSSTKPKASTQKNGELYSFVWTEELQPYESVTVTVTENYLGITILVIALFLIGVLMYVKRPPIFVKKDIAETHAHEGGISKVKILLNVKNRSLHKIKEIKVVDKVPKLLHLSKHTALGSLKPSTIKKTKKHETLIMWKIEELMPGEERVITYELESKLKILGGLTVQPAMASFYHKDKEVKTRSNKTLVRV